MTDKSTVRQDLWKIYAAVHETPDGEPHATATMFGQHLAIWDALFLLAARIDGDFDADPRGERAIKPDEFYDPADDPANDPENA